MMELLLTLVVGAVFCAGVFALWVGRSFHPPTEIQPTLEFRVWRTREEEFRTALVSA